MTYVFYRCHTLAFIPSRGRVYAFGLGGSGQLGLKSSNNMTSPQPVIGPWVAPNSSIQMEVEDFDDTSAIQTISVRKIFCGGDQSFALVSPNVVSN